MALRIIGSFLHVGDLGKEGLDRDDDLSILVDLEQRALSAELLDGVERLNNILAALTEPLVYRVNSLFSFRLIS